MTKRNMLLVSLLLVFGLGATAPSIFAQSITSPPATFWSVSATQNAGMRHEGDAEGTGMITLSLTSAGTIKSGTKLYFTYNTPIANNNVPSVESAVDVVCTGSLGAGCPYLAAFGPSTLVNSTVQTAGYLGSTDPPVSPSPPNNQVYLLFTTDVPVSYSASGCGISNTCLSVSVRSTVQGYPANFPVAVTVKSTSPVGTPDVFTLGSTANPVTSNIAFKVGTVSATQALALAFDEGPAHVLTCIGVKDINYYDDDFSIRFTENWANALTSLSDEWALENDTMAGVPTNGSNILVTFTEIPPGLTISETDVYSDCGTYTAGPHGCPGGALNVTYVSNTGPPQCALDASIPPKNVCTQGFMYSVNQTSTAVIENGVLRYALRRSGPVAPNMEYQIQATVALTDALVPNVPPDMPWFSQNETPTMSVVEFSDCITSLLFPYINTFQGNTVYAFSHFGTGIDFANTTWDPFALPTGTCVPKTGAGCTYPDLAKGSAVPQSGSCTLYIYPADEGTTIVYTTPSISAGGSYGFDVQTQTGWMGTGYGIAICSFQNAYGTAEIYDNFEPGNPTFGILTPGTAVAYLAYVLPNPAFYHRSPAGDGLGESAIAPWNINKRLAYELLYGGGL